MAVALFFVFAGLAVLGALGVLTCRNPIHSAMSLVGTMVSLAVIYLLHHAEFIFAIQLMVYAGAVMMLIVFVIMLLDIRKEEGAGKRPSGAKLVGLVWAGLLFVLLVVPLASRLTGVTGGMTLEAREQVGSVELIADELFTTYLLPFEAAGILLLVGLVGAVVLAKKRL
ncbi:MAG: NADH-quinone oxidoreductase subunit J [Deferrisomatales bacterium]|nr:NADH-quinone oxidoreductase subunit J [Deferrisomatales bacterium]